MINMGYLRSDCGLLLPASCFLLPTSYFLLIRSSLVMGPHPDDLDCALGTIDLINQTMLNVDAAGIRAREISDEFLVRRRTLKRIFRDDVKKPLCLRSKVCRSDLPGVFLGLPGVNDRPAHQPGFFSAFLSGSAIPLRMESRIPGIDIR